MNTDKHRSSVLLFICVYLCSSVVSVFAQSVAGLWDATVVVNEVEVPFRIEFSGEGPNLKGWFFNGEDKVTSTSGHIENGSVILDFDHYAARLEVQWKEGILQGRYRVGASSVYPFRAKRFQQESVLEKDIPAIGGLWEVAVKSPKGESAWQFIVRQSGAQVSAAILRIDGDTGTLSGSYRGGKFILSHFSGVRPLLLEVKPLGDGSLELVYQSAKDRPTYRAVRPAEARAKGLPGPTDPTQHTRMKDPSEPFRFSFPDLRGRIVSEKDFRGKVVVVNIMGSWCPNCHDEVPFLVELYRKYHNQGLEIVGLSFEGADQLKDPARLRAFIRQYGIAYTVLLAGLTSEAPEKLSQVENLNAWPTTFFLGRDGRVRHVHVGFASVATGELHQRGKEEVTSVVERLLGEAPSGN